MEMSDTIHNHGKFPTAAVSMPHLGETITEARVTGWLKRVGDYVRADEPLLTVDTDKTDIDVPSPASGHLIEILVDADETVLVGTKLGLIAVTAEQSRERSEKIAVAYAVESYRLTAPDWIAGVSEPSVARWLKKENDQIAVEDPLVEVSTEHGDVAILSPVAGIMRHIFLVEDAPVRSGSTLAHIEILVARASS